MFSDVLSRSLLLNLLKKNSCLLLFSELTICLLSDFYLSANYSSFIFVNFEIIR